MNFEARTVKKNSFIFGFGRGAQVGKASFLEVNLRRKRRRWAYHFYLVRFRPWDPTNPRFLEEDGGGKNDTSRTKFLCPPSKKELHGKIIGSDTRDYRVRYSDKQMIV